MNVVIMSGRVGKDAPTLKNIAGSGKAVCNFSIAVPRPFAEKRNTDWFNVIAWGKLGENAAQYLFPGARTVVKGYMQTREYEDKKNPGVKKKLTELVADTIEFLDKKGNTVATVKASEDDTPFGASEHEEQLDFSAADDEDLIPF